MVSTVIMGSDDTKRVEGSQDETYRENCDVVVMEEPYERLLRARERAGFGDAASAARAFGWNEVTYRAHESGVRGLRPSVAEKYAKAFKVSAAWLLTGEGVEPQANPIGPSEVKAAPFKVAPIPIIGKTEAGAFRTVLEYDDSEPEYVFDEADPEFPTARQMAFDVEGKSMNEADPPILPGARIICVDFAETGMPLLDGMIVVVERSEDGGRTREWSVKEVQIEEGRTVLMPRSSDKKIKPIIVPDNKDPDDGIMVQVIALVRNVSYSVSAGRRKRRPVR